MTSNATSNSGAARNDDAVYTVSVAAQLVGMHAQTLRQYDRLGLVSPSRAKGRGRRYSAHDVHRLREVQRLTKEEGINLAGVQLALQLRQEIADLETQIRELSAALQSSAVPAHRVFAADSEGYVIQRPPQKGLPGEGQGDERNSWDPSRLEPPSRGPSRGSNREGPRSSVAAASIEPSRPRTGVSLAPSSAGPLAHGRSLALQSDLRGWQQLAVMQMQRHYRERADGMLPKHPRPGARTL